MYSKTTNKNILFSNKVSNTPSVKVYLPNREQKERSLHETFPHLWKVTKHSHSTKPSSVHNR